MTKKSIYTSSELPDGALEEFEEITDIFLCLLEELSEHHSMTAINAGMARAQLLMLQLAKPGCVKRVLLDNAEYFLKAAEMVKE